jgi:hypothetical protein
MQFQLKKTISFKAGTKGNWCEDDSDSCSHYSASTKQSGGSQSSFSLRSLQSSISSLDNSFSSLPEKLPFPEKRRYHDSMENDRLLDCENESHSGSHCSGSTKQSTMSLPAFSLKSLQSKVSRKSSLDSSFSSLPIGSLRRRNLKSSFSSLQERLASRNYDKLDEDRFDLSLVLEEIANGSIDFDCCQGDSAGTLPTVVDPPSDEEASLDDKESVHSSALCHLPSGMQGLVRVMINTRDPTCATIWVNSPNSARKHLELNITPTTPKAKQRRKVRRNAIRRPPVRSLVVPF